VHAAGVYFLSIRSAEGTRSLRFFMD
jgi:hypothetical protein